MQVVLLQSDGLECHALQFVHRSSISSEEVATTVYCLDASDPFWWAFPLLNSSDLEFIAATVNRFLTDSLGQNVPSSMLTSSDPAADLERAADEGCLFGSIPLAPPQALASHDLPLCGYQGIKSIERTGEDGVKVTLRFLRVGLNPSIVNLVILGIGPGLIASAIAWALGEAVGKYYLLWLGLCALGGFGSLSLSKKVQVKQTSQLTVGSREWSLVQCVPTLARASGQRYESVQKGLLTDLTGAKVCMHISNLHTCTALIPVTILQCGELSENMALRFRACGCSCMTCCAGIHI
jgi:hypothetical protein